MRGVTLGSCPKLPVYRRKEIAKLTQQELDSLKPGDWLVFANPRTPAMREVRLKITAIRNVGSARVATIMHWDGNYCSGINDCELNSVSFGSFMLADRLSE